MAAMRAVKKAELARILNVSKARITQYCKAGLPVLDDGRVDVDQATAWVRANLDPAKRSDWATGRAVDRHVQAGSASAPPRAVPATNVDGVPRAALKVLSELPSTIALAVADAGGSRTQAAHALRIVLEVMHDELLSLAEHAGQAGDPGDAWRLEAKRLVLGGQKAVRWESYFGPGGQSICTDEIYGAASS